MDVVNTTLLSPAVYSCTNEIVGLSIFAGLFSAASIITWAILYLKKTNRISCPYCNQPFEQTMLREHLQDCGEHLKNYRPNGRKSIIQELNRNAFYALSERKIPIAEGHPPDSVLAESI